MLRGRSVAASLWASGAKTGTREQGAQGFGPALSRRSMSLKCAPDLSYDVPPANERKGKTRAESDRHLGNLIVTHRSTLIRYPAGTMALPRQERRWHELGGGPAGTMVRTDLCQHRLTRSPPMRWRRSAGTPGPPAQPAPAAFLESANGMLIFAFRIEATRLQIRTLVPGTT
jgi:hypothetical protein